MSNYWAHTWYLFELLEFHIDKRKICRAIRDRATYFSLHEDWDPVAAGIRWLYNKLNFCTRLKNKLSGAKSRTKLDEEQSESLIDNMPVLNSCGMVAKIPLQTIT
ncbi:hypothetical protein T12_10421 [Trichinella patagoniensis]|uniref:Uncharacterized protein n=1 Tax=Trichinella patagoniensis TaxID=990121 RepID=A0A0V0ZEN8_9BILA|nr:hypothetical protein T12_4453 [Trichinella patagoniensis]KRY22650.1 hypothetical protein T12_10421 [Trichinella patagoniensis]